MIPSPDLRERFDEEIRAAFPEVTGTRFLLGAWQPEPQWIIFEAPVAPVRVDFLPGQEPEPARRRQIQEWISGTFQWELTPKTSGEVFDELLALPPADFQKLQAATLAYLVAQDPSLWDVWRGVLPQLQRRKVGPRPARDR